jgi:hypothetical protein
VLYTGTKEVFWTVPREEEEEGAKAGHFPPEPGLLLPLYHSIFISFFQLQFTLAERRRRHGGRSKGRRRGRGIFPPGPRSVWPLFHSNFLSFFQLQCVLAERRRRAWWAVKREKEGAGHFPTWAWVCVAPLSL